MSDGRLWWLALSAVPGIGPATFHRLVDRFGDAERALLAPPDKVADLLTAEVIQALAQNRKDGPLAAAERILSASERAGAQILLATDAEFPPALHDLGPVPPVLYIRGSAEVLTAPAVGVVGTRRPSGYGRAVAADVGDELGAAGVVVVSGLAIGVDGIAQAAAIDAGGRSVAVLPSPIDRIYPPNHRSLAERILTTGGALVSEVPPGRAIGKPDFARRNRIIAGLPRTVVVIEAPDRSGALLTAAAAVAIGRELFAVPGPIDSPQSQGTNRLIADHLATLLTSPAALIHQSRALVPVPGRVAVGLSEVEQRVLDRVVRRSASIEELQGETGLGTPSLASALTLLEARGLVSAYAGATFHPTTAARRMSRER
jgi:DNA processing protein